MEHFHETTNGLMPSGKQLLPNIMLAQSHVAIWCHKATINYVRNKLRLAYAFVV